MKNLNDKKTMCTTKTDQELVHTMNHVLARACHFGATDAQALLSYDHGYAVDVRMGEVEKVIFSEDKAVSLTVYLANRKGSASSTDTSDKALDELVKAAIEIAKVSADDKHGVLPDKDLMQHHRQDLDLYHPWDIKPKEAIELALLCESEALAFDKRIVNSDGVSLSTYNFHYGFANTLGGLGVNKGSRHNISCSLIAKENNTMQRDYDYTTSRIASELRAIELLAISAATRTVKRLGARKILTKKVPVVFSSRVSGSLISSFISAISGANLYRKNTFLADSIGQQVFPKNITIYEQPHLLRALGSSPFDSEGVATRANIFVNSGEIIQYALGSYSARRLGLKTTANAGGVHNLTVDPTAGDLDILLKKMDTGLLVTELMGSGVNGLTGDYSRGASGFWVEQGIIQFPVEEITIAGNLKNMFKQILAVGNDINLNLSCRCGSILIEQMTIAGQ